MKEILLVAPTENVYKNALETRHMHGFDNIEIVKGALEDGLKIAREYYDRYAPEVIISRGGTYTMIKSSISVPAVEIRVSASDCIAAYKELESFDEKIAIVGYANVIKDFQIMRGIVRGNYTFMTIRNQEEIPEVIKKCREQGIKKIVGDVTVQRIAIALNCTGILIESQEESILLAMQQAETILDISKAQTRKHAEIKSVIDNVGEAVFYTYPDGRIRIKNLVAEQMMRAYAIPQTAGITQILPINSITEEGVKGLVCNINGVRYIVNSSPTYDKGSFSGKVFSLQKSEDISNFEHKLRRSIDKKGFIAKYNFSDIVHVSPAMDAVIEKAMKFAAVESPILINGESGTGKELLCQSIHNMSRHNDGPFVAINCAAISPSLIESELFGYEAGAFTNAHKNGKAGIFELAHNGTLFLDEISEIPLEMQSRLLRAIQEKQVMRIGGEKIIPVNVRIICATNKNLREMMKSGRFRADLYYRISILKLSIPKLSERPEDIIPLAEFFIKEYSKKYGIRELQLGEKEKKHLLKKDYEGNIRELEGLMEESVVLNSFANLYAEEDGYGSIPGERDKSIASGFVYDDELSLDENETELIRYVYEKNGKNITETTKKLGISRTTLWRKLGRTDT